ncbi:SdpI/YhfL family protein [Sinobaca qinghaiensis]|uniref:SdpI/YhfL family protein n=1 Tax=Sinobaca qinghaiensis TaxID=342944 RepID=A0A419UWR9_9BACL|nr:SdpI family protein [Sinobaca qinghaiensis]RKD69571.1 SdpI/YhfL family protein [Sinobaca qinghaiensis]
MLVFLTGLGTLVAGIVLKISSPARINNVYGYRTQRSKKNQKLWDVSQEYSAKILRLMGVLNILIGIVLMFTTYSQEYYLFFELGWVVLSFLPVFILTERKLVKIERS